MVWVFYEKKFMGKFYFRFIYRKESNKILWLFLNWEVLFWLWPIRWSQQHITKMLILSVDCLCLEIRPAWHRLLSCFISLSYFQAMYRTKCVIFLIVPMTHFYSYLSILVTALALFACSSGGIIIFHISTFQKHRIRKFNVL